MTNNKQEAVHVITSVERRRRWSVFEKKAIVEEWSAPHKERTVWLAD
jgi:hypothetical protein